MTGFRFPSPHQSLQLSSTGPHSPPKLRWHGGVLLAVDLAAQRRALQGTDIEVEDEGHKGVELAVVERRMDQAKVG